MKKVIITIMTIFIMLTLSFLSYPQSAGSKAKNPHEERRQKMEKQCRELFGKSFKPFFKYLQDEGISDKHLNQGKEFICRDAKRSMDRENIDKYNAIESALYGAIRTNTLKWKEGVKRKRGEEAEQFARKAIAKLKQLEGVKEKTVSEINFFKGEICPAGLSWNDELLTGIKKLIKKYRFIQPGVESWSGEMIKLINPKKHLLVRCEGKGNQERCYFYCLDRLKRTNYGNHFCSISEIFAGRGLVLDLKDLNKYYPELVSEKGARLLKIIKNEPKIKLDSNAWLVWFIGGELKDHPWFSDFAFYWSQKTKELLGASFVIRKTNGLKDIIVNRLKEKYGEPVIKEERNLHSGWRTATNIIWGNYHNTVTFHEIEQKKVPESWGLWYVNHDNMNEVLEEMDKTISYAEKSIKKRKQSVKDDL